MLMIDVKKIKKHAKNFWYLTLAYLFGYTYMFTSMYVGTGIWTFNLFEHYGLPSSLGLTTCYYIFGLWAFNAHISYFE